MTRLFLSLGLIGFVLSGCGQQSQPRERLKAACVADAQPEATCECLVSALETRLPPELFQRLAVAVGREQREIGDFIRSLPQDDQLELGAALSDMFACTLSPPVESAAD